MSASVFQDLRLDLAILRKLIDHSLDKGVPGTDPLLKACATVFAHKREHLHRLEAATWKHMQRRSDNVTSRFDQPPRTL